MYSRSKSLGVFFMYVNMKKEFLGDITTTKDIIIPKDPLERVIGHDDIIKFVKIAAKQRRNLLLVGSSGYREIIDSPGNILSL